MEMLADGSALVGHDAACDLIVLGSTATERIAKSQPRFDEQSLRLVDHADDTRACQCRILDGRSGESFGPARMAKAHHHTARKMDVDDGCVMLFPKRYKAEGGTALADMWHACRLERVKYTTSNWTSPAREEWKKVSTSAHRQRQISSRIRSIPASPPCRHLPPNSRPLTTSPSILANASICHYRQVKSVCLHVGHRQFHFSQSLLHHNITQYNSTRSCLPSHPSSCSPTRPPLTARRSIYSSPPPASPTPSSSSLLSFRVPTSRLWTSPTAVFPSSQWAAMSTPTPPPSST
jgi:hypothetical protein